MNILDNYTNQFLIATPALVDTIFRKSVVYIYEHNSQGATGIIVNKPIRLNLGNFLKHLEIPSVANSVSALPVLMGGPVNQENGFVLYRTAQGKQTISNPIEISTSKDILKKIALGRGPKEFAVALGYSGWSEGQLEREIKNNDWLVAPADPVELFTTPINQLWRHAAYTIGVDVDKLSTLVGHD